MSNVQNNQSILSYDASPKISRPKTEENPTHFLELTNSSSSDAVKIIKVKIIVPKGTLKNSKFDHKSNVLTVMNEIDKISVNIRTITEPSEVLKITNILNTEDGEITCSGPNVKGVSNQQCRLKSNYPVMGTNALLAKAEEKLILSDSVIIEKLVTERYQDCMIDLYQRNYKRQTSRRSSMQTSRTVSEASVDDKDVNYNFVNNIKHSSTMLNDLQEPTCHQNMEYYQRDLASLEYCTMMDYHDEVLNDVPIEPIVQLNSSRDSQEDKSFNYSDLNVDVTLGSAIDFILSTNGTSTEEQTKSPGEMLLTSVSVNSNTNTQQSKSDFDEDKFLERALGSELINYVSTEEGTRGSTALDTNDASLISSRSINSSDISVLLSKASSLYSMVSSKIRRLSRRLPVQSSDGTISEEDIAALNTSTSNERITRLMQESVIQHQIMMQTAKAVGYCMSVKEFIGSVEQMEAERMLLLATCKREGILESIRKLEYEEHHANPEDQHETSRGTITISNLTFHPKESNYRSHSDQSNNQWFVCIINCNGLTYGTEAKIMDKDGFVRFDEKFQLGDLGIDFDIKISLYGIKLKNTMRSYSHESKYHLKDTKGNNILCPPTPSKSFIQHLTLTRSLSNNLNIPSCKHSFLSLGMSILRLNHFVNNCKKSCNYYRLGKVPTEVTNLLSGIFSADVETGLEVRAREAGFITIGQGNTITWSRHWCELEGSELRWWNYPQQVGVAKTEALGTIDLQTCLTARITSVDRNICARPRTLVIDMVNPQIQYGSSSNPLNSSDNNITRYFLSCDNMREMQIWERKLNDVLGILRAWNMMVSNKRFPCTLK